jgi:hypothetical protein
MSKINTNLIKAKADNCFKERLTKTFITWAYYNATELSYLSAQATYKGKERALLKAELENKEPVNINNFLIKDIPKATKVTKVTKDNLPPPLTLRDKIAFLLASKKFIKKPVCSMPLTKHTLSLLKILKLVPIVSLVLLKLE